VSCAHSRTPWDEGEKKSSNLVNEGAVESRFALGRHDVAAAAKLEPAGDGDLERVRRGIEREEQGDEVNRAQQRLLVVNWADEGEN
jgi:hypothetical protein